MMEPIRKRLPGEPRNELQTRVLEAIEKYSEPNRHGQPPVCSLSHRPGSGSARLDENTPLKAVRWQMMLCLRLKGGSDEEGDPPQQPQTEGVPPKVITLSLLSPS